MPDTLWTREVLHRLRAQYPLIAAADLEALLALWWRVLEPLAEEGLDLRADVERQVRAAVQALSATLAHHGPTPLAMPQQRPRLNPVRAR